jgi:hypothetical protein
MPKRSRKGRQIQLDRARARTFADHQVELRVFHGRIQHFLDDRTQAVYFIDEQYIAGFEIGEQRRQVAGALEHRTGGLPQIHLQFVGDDVRQSGLAETRRPEYQDMIQGFAAHARRLDENVHLGFDVWLPDVVAEALWAYRAVDQFIVAAAGAGNHPILFYAHKRF